MADFGKYFRAYMYMQDILKRIKLYQWYIKALMITSILF